MRTSRFLAGGAVVGSAAALLSLFACQDTPEPTAPTLAVVERRTLTVTGSGTGNGVVKSTPAGINCTITAGRAGTSGCKASFVRGTVVRLAVTPASGHAFELWERYCLGYAQCEPEMSANRNVQARFMKGPFQVRISSGGGGGRGTVRTQSGVTPAINCTINGGAVSGTCSARYPANREIVLTATPSSGQGFAGWSGVCGGEGTCRYKAVKPVTIPASFSPASPTNATQGRWGPAFQTPVVAIHTHLLPSGKVMTWGTKGETHLWDPANTGLGFVPLAKTYQLFCSGHTFLPDGRLLVVGGHISSDRGLPLATIYDPVTTSWSNTGSLAQGRWYPTATTLPDGDVLAVAGADEEGTMVRVPEVWRNGTWDRLTGASLELPYYPTMFVAPDGRVFMAGPDVTSRYLDTDGEGEWTTAAQRVGPDREAGTAVMYDIGKILYAGGGDPPTASAEVIDLNASTPAWRAVAPMATPRRHLLATVLADGQVLVTHGTSGAGFNDVTKTVRDAELWNPETESWRTLSREGAPRAYHSTAVLLPDGRVLSSGSGEGNGITYSDSELSAQIFTPPYLFKPDGSPATRPALGAAPSFLEYGAAFTVESEDAAEIARGSLVRLSSATHSFNMSQLHIPLAFTSTGATTLQAVAPAGATVAPPGPYMLFLLDGAGVPSVARIVNVGP